MIPFLIAGLDGRLERWDFPSPMGAGAALLGRSLLRRVASKAVKVTKQAVTSANPISAATNVAHVTAKTTRALAKPAQDLARGKVSQAFVDLGRAGTAVAAAPVVAAAASVGQGKTVEGFIDRNDPNALINRKTLEILKRVARPIVRSFAGFLGDDDESTSLRSKLRAQRAKIIAAVTAPGTAAATSAGGPYAGAAAAALLPVAVDAVIDEVAAAAKSAIEKAAGGGSDGSGAVDATAGAAGSSASARKYLPVVLVAAAGAGGFIWWRRHRRRRGGK